MFKTPYDKEFELMQEMEHNAYQRGYNKGLSIINKIKVDIEQLIAFNTEDDYISEAGQGMQDCLDIINKYIGE